MVFLKKLSIFLDLLKHRLKKKFKKLNWNLKNSQDGDGVHGRNERAEEKAVKDGEALGVPVETVSQVDEGADRGGVPEGADDGVEQDSAEVLEEGSQGHEVAGVEHYRGQ